MSITSKTIHFDSINSSYTSQSAFESTYNLTTPLNYLKTVSLESLELPINFTTIREGSGSLNTISVLINSVVYNLTLPSKNYSAINDLLVDLNSLCYNINGTYRVNFAQTSASAVTSSVSSNNGVTLSKTDRKIIVTVSSTNLGPLIYKLIDTQLLNYVLGIKPNPVVSAAVLSESQVGVSDYNLNPDNYIIFNIVNYSFENTNASNINCNFKVPVNAVFGDILYYSALNLRQTLNCGITTVNYLKINILDRFGSIIYAPNNDYSFSLRFECDNGSSDVDY